MSAKYQRNTTKLEKAREDPTQEDKKNNKQIPGLASSAENGICEITASTSRSQKPGREAGNR